MTERARWLDLSILGTPEEACDRFEAGIRREYGWVPDPIFTAARLGILHGFMARPSVYWTDAFRSKYEAQARRNLSRTLARLGSV